MKKVHIEFYNDLSDKILFINNGREKNQEITWESNEWFIKKKYYEIDV